MKRRITALVLALAAVFATATPAQAAPQRPRSTSFIAFMNGHNEVPPADPDATGVAMFSLKRNGQLCWVIFTHKVDGMLTGAHIHASATDMIVVPLSTAPVGCTWVNRKVAWALRMYPTSYYVNVHSTVWPKGALRGTLMKAGSSH
jgi:CHRD domain